MSKSDNQVYLPNLVDLPCDVLGGINQMAFGKDYCLQLKMLWVDKTSKNVNFKVQLLDSKNNNIIQQQKDWWPIACKTAAEMTNNLLMRMPPALETTLKKKHEYYVFQELEVLTDDALQYLESDMGPIINLKEDGSIPQNKFLNLHGTKMKDVMKSYLDGFKQGIKNYNERTHGNLADVSKSTTQTFTVNREGKENPELGFPANAFTFTTRYEFTLYNSAGIQSTQKKPEHTDNLVEVVVDL